MWKACCCGIIFSFCGCQTAIIASHGGQNTGSHKARRGGGSLPSPWTLYLVFEFVNPDPSTCATNRRAFPLKVMNTPQQKGTPRDHISQKLKKIGAALSQRLSHPWTWFRAIFSAPSTALADSFIMIHRFREELVLSFGPKV